mmetsp:Transcript_75141/g.113237  ORF Transcript_75141/g.113237 Transcript_75141/m.113237 type:complete len:212 (+) Transcript_75141:94-729(+)
MDTTMTVSDQTSINSSRGRNGAKPDSLRIRKNLMLKLGVDAELIQTTETRRAPSRGGTLLGKVKLSTEPLKGNDPEEDVNTLTNLVSFFTGSKPSSSSPPEPEDPASLTLSSSVVSEVSSVALSDGESASRKLTFNEEVSVCPIPKREEYSKRIREHLWNSPQDMMMNCERNSIEFAAEGWDWRNSLEDEHMYRCVATNELIHPVHVEGQI